MKMGYVQRERRNEGQGLHEWDYVSMGEERVVRILITRRGS